jgi:hypothetical protein
VAGGAPAPQPNTLAAGSAPKKEAPAGVACRPRLSWRPPSIKSVWYAAAQANAKGKAPALVPFAAEARNDRYPGQSKAVLQGNKDSPQRVLTVG